MISLAVQGTLKSLLQHHSSKVDGETVETVSDFILGGSKITADGDCSHEIKRRLLLGKDSDAGRDWGQEEKGMTEDEMAGWHH